MRSATIESNRRGGSVTVDTRVVGTITVLQVHGLLTISQGDSGLRRAVRDALDNGAKTVVINLQDVPAVDSSGVSELVSAYTEVANRGGRLKICHLSQKLKDILVITRLNTMFDAYETEVDAIASAQSA